MQDGANEAPGSEDEAGNDAEYFGVQLKITDGGPGNNAWDRYNAISIHRDYKDSTQGARWGNRSIVHAQPEPGADLGDGPGVDNDGGGSILITVETNETYSVVVNPLVAGANMVTRMEVETSAKARRWCHSFWASGYGKPGRVCKQRCKSAGTGCRHQLEVLHRQ